MLPVYLPEKLRDLSDDLFAEAVCFRRRHARPVMSLHSHCIGDRFATLGARLPRHNASSKYWPSSALSGRYIS
jgi:hypothetical protein